MMSIPMTGGNRTSRCRNFWTRYTMDLISWLTIRQRRMRTSREKMGPPGEAVVPSTDRNTRNIDTIPSRRVRATAVLPLGGKNCRVTEWFCRISAILSLNRWYLVWGAVWSSLPWKERREGGGLGGGYMWSFSATITAVFWLLHADLKAIKIINFFNYDKRGLVFYKIWLTWENIDDPLCCKTLNK